MFNGQGFNRAEAQPGSSFSFSGGGSSTAGGPGAFGGDVNATPAPVSSAFSFGRSQERREPSQADGAPPSTGFAFGRPSNSMQGGGAGSFGGGQPSQPTQPRRSLVRSQGGRSVDALAGPSDRPIWEQASATAATDGAQQQQPAPRRSLRERLGQTPGPDTAVALGGKKKLTWVAPGLEEREARELAAAQAERGAQGAAGQPLRGAHASRMGRAEGGSASRQDADSVSVKKKKPSWMTPEMEAEQAAALGKQQGFVGASGGGVGGGSGETKSAAETPGSKGAQLNARAMRFAPQPRRDTPPVERAPRDEAAAPHGAIEDDSGETTFEGAIVGTCDEMCPHEERITRQQQVRMRTPSRNGGGCATTGTHDEFPVHPSVGDGRLGSAAFKCRGC